MSGKLYLVGLGLFDATDITLKALNVLKKDCEFIFIENYTSVLVGSSMQDLSALIGKPIAELRREELETTDTPILLTYAKNNKVALLVAGDPLIATTHIDLRLRALDLGIETEVIHNASVVTAVAGLLGLQYYKFGRTTSLPFPTPYYFPQSPYQIIYNNRKNNLHTLVLLDLEFDPKLERKRYMNANEAIDILLRLALDHQRRYYHRRLSKRAVLTADSLLCVVARAGSPNPMIRADHAKKLLHENFGPPLHTLVVPAPNLHYKEAEALVKLAGAPAKLLIED